MNLNNRNHAPGNLSPAHLKIDMPAPVSFIIDTLYANGFEAYAVGGCVRDALLGRVPHDWDITTSAKPEQVKALFSRTIDTGIQHGTVTIMIGSEGYEVTTYRIDGVYEDARHPKDVTFTANLLEDLKRRDLTINAMAYNDVEGLIDAFGGTSDLEKKIIRCVGDPEARFGEDALRMFRAVRFGAQLGFQIHPDTAAAVKKLAPTIAKVSAERILSELVKLLTSPHPEEIRTACELGLTAVFFPEFDRMMETEQHNKHHLYTVGEHTIKTLAHVPADKGMRLTMLLHDIAKPSTKTTDEDGWDHFYGHPEKGAKMAEDILRRWKMDNNTIAFCTNLVRWHDYRPAITEKSVRKAMNRIGTEALPDLFTVMEADVQGQSSYQKEEKLAYIALFRETYQKVLDEGHCVSKSSLAISGKDLIALGIRPGKQMGQILEDLFQIVLDEPELNGTEKLLEIVRTRYLA